MVVLNTFPRGIVFFPFCRIITCDITCEVDKLPWYCLVLERIHCPGGLVALHYLGVSNLALRCRPQLAHITLEDPARADP